VKLESENNELDRARELLKRARAAADTERIWMKSALFEWQTGRPEEALAILEVRMRCGRTFGGLRVIGLEERLIAVNELLLMWSSHPDGVRQVRRVCEAVDDARPDQQGARPPRRRAPGVQPGRMSLASRVPCKVEWRAVIDTNLCLALSAAKVPILDTAVAAVRAAGEGRRQRDAGALHPRKSAAQEPGHSAAVVRVHAMWTAVVCHACPQCVGGSDVAGCRLCGAGSRRCGWSWTRT
jgi:hypothetical protein